MVYQFKIKLRGVSKPPVWRKVEVPAHFTFQKFHFVIQAAMGWYCEHLYQFSKQPYTCPVIAESEEDIFNEPDYDAAKYRLKDYFEEFPLTKKFVYTYDFGDDWQHECILEGTLPDNRLFAICTAGKGACPEEDCGGPWGWEEMKETGEIDEEEAKYFDLEKVQEAVKTAHTDMENPF
jgi:Plasmid pRiA4b ORF-3-like protein.